MNEVKTRVVEPHRCPLCGTWEAVPFTGEHYDYETHAKECEELKEIEEPYRKLYLQSKIEKRAFRERFTDNLTFDQYEDIFKEHGFFLDVRMYREKIDTEGKIRNWAFSITVESSKYSRNSLYPISHFPSSDGRYIDDAFALLKHYLVCGEKIKICVGSKMKIWHWDHNKRDLVYEEVLQEEKR